MADIISRLKLESGEFDSKIKRAGQELIAYSEHCRKTGLEMGYANRDAKEFAKALGNMQTTSATARGKISELSDAFVNLRVMYKNMTDEEKNNQFGKNLAASLDKLKIRIQDAKKDLADVTAELNDNGEAGKGTSSVMEMLKDKFTVNIDAIKLFNIGLQAAEGALSVAKDAFFASEASVDEWGRVVDSSKSLYEGFLTALNTGDISGYLGRIDEIVTAARKAYDELDRLGTMRTIQAPKMSAQQTENERMRMMIQTGRYIAPVDGRRASMKDGQLLTPDQIRRIEAQLQNGMKSVVTLVGNEVRQTGKAIDAVYNRQAQELGMSLKEFRKGTSSMAEFDKRMAGYDQYQKWREQHTTIDMQSGREIVARGNPFEQFAKWGTFRVDGQRYNDLVRLIQQRDQQAGQAYSMQSQAYRTMNRAEGVTVSKLMRGETDGGTSKGSTTRRTADDIIREQGLAMQRHLYAGVDGIGPATDTGASAIWRALVEREDRRISDRRGTQDALEALNKAEGISPSGREREKSREDRNMLATSKDLLNGVSQLTDGLEKIGIDIPDEIQAVIGVVQGVMQVIDAVNTIIGVTQTTALTANTVAMTSLTAALWANTASSWIPFANGGVVRAAGGFVTGNTYSGDQIPALLNAGEVVLNRAQTGNLASQLQGNGFGNARLVGRLKGRDILISIDRELSATGKGQLATWK